MQLPSSTHRQVTPSLLGSLFSLPSAGWACSLLPLPVLPASVASSILPHPPIYSLLSFSPIFSFHPPFSFSTYSPTILVNFFPALIPPVSEFPSSLLLSLRPFLPDCRICLCRAGSKRNGLRMTGVLLTPLVERCRLLGGALSKGKRRLPFQCSCMGQPVTYFTWFDCL